MRLKYLKLTHVMIAAFVILAVVILAAGLVGFHYLERVRMSQAQFADEWEEYRHMVLAEDVLKNISKAISAWQAGILPVETLKLNAQENAIQLSAWAQEENESNRNNSLIAHEQEEEHLLDSARDAFLELIKIIDKLPSQPTPVVSAALITSLDKLQGATYPLRQFYFDSMQVSLSKSKNLRDKALHDSIYFMVILFLLILAISSYSIKILRGQTQLLLEQERQLASVTLVQHLAHEIRNPLGIMKSAAGVIAKRSSPEVAALAHDISLEVERVDGLLTDLLHLRRGYTKPKELADISAIVMKVVDLFASKVRESDLRIDVQHKASGILCLCHPEAIKQVVMNLILNAIEASEPKNTIHILTDVVGNNYTVQVRDYGSGIKTANKDKIFDLLFTTKPYGFGIGLTVVKRIIDDHGGSIEVTSPEPRGTAFTIYLPLKG